METFTFEFANGISPDTERKELSLDAVLNMLQNPGSIKAERSYIPGTLKNHRRATSNVESRSMLTLDLDGALDGGKEALEEYLKPSVYLWHTTFSHTPEDPHYRYLIPLATEVSAEDYRRIIDHIIVENHEASIDPSSAKPAQIMFTPAAKHPEHYQFGAHLVGEYIFMRGGDYDVTPHQAEVALLDPKVFLSDERAGEYIVPLARSAGQKGDPESAPGIIGEFNKAFPDFGELIDTFDLPYAPEGEGLWRYKGTTSAAGVSEVEGRPGLWWSWHSTDPASGYAQNAFDMVRIHKFGHLDEGLKGSRPANRMPSFKAAKEYVSQNETFISRSQKNAFAAIADNLEGMLSDTDLETAPETVKTLPRQSAVAAQKPAEPSTAWVKELVTDKDGAVKDTIGNLDILSENDPVLRRLAWCERGNYESYVPVSEARNDDAKPQPLTTHGVYDLMSHLERVYGLRLSKTRMEQVIGSCMQKHRFDPVQDYLTSLEWDGVSRLETCLPGAEDNEYNRLVARKALVGAVARAMDPGCKADLSLILYGTAGIGKTWWIEQMSRGFSAPLGNIEHKDTLIIASQSWIVVSDEGHAMNKADFNRLKEFMTQAHDVYRAPYERSAVTTPRRWVVWGSTNDPYILRQREGNRRFLIVDCKEKADFTKYTDEYVAQVWAEAVHLWRLGETPFLTEAEELLADLMRENHTQADMLSGSIEEFIEQPVPAGWEDLPVSSRMAQSEVMAVGAADFADSELRKTISVPELWCEMMHKPLGDLGFREQRRILETLLGMTQSGKLRRRPQAAHVSGYGTQIVFDIVRE